MPEKMCFRTRAVGAAILFLALTTACLIPGIPTGVPPTPTSMTDIIVTDTSAPPTATATIRPTATSTPPPEWVTDFTQPILDAIADRPPDFQDDFHDNSKGWERTLWLGCSLEITDGEMLMSTVGSCAQERPILNYADFVMLIDVRFLPGSDAASYWMVEFRSNNPGAEGADHEFQICPDGTIKVNMYDADGKEFMDRANRTPNSNTIMIIARDDQFAFYVNGVPLYYTENTQIRTGRSVLWLQTPTHASVALDNFQIWDLSNLP